MTNPILFYFLYYHCKMLHTIVIITKFIIFNILKVIFLYSIKHKYITYNEYMKYIFSIKKHFRFSGKQGLYLTSFRK